jgi:N-acetylmuramic acid 6-phosphate etherase
MIKYTEQPSPYRNLEQKTVEELTKGIITEYKNIVPAIENAIEQLNSLIEAVVGKLNTGGRAFYLGAGTGGRLAVLDVLELPTTFGMENGMFSAVLAGGMDKLIYALEEKEDDIIEGWEMLTKNNISKNDIVIGISASGTTPFVLHGLKKCRENGITTCCVVNNPDSPIASVSDYPIEVITGPEFITGSTRMKAGTSQKIIFDIISTTTMIRMGRVLDNKMINVQLINKKITDRAVRMLMEMMHSNDYEKSQSLLYKYGSVKKVLDNIEQLNIS